ncbi:YwiC-like family protein [Timonella sp. A28]|uniref:YwiC-like family protein n=1 Tax=Timonella sp. A28 TaxID=3442640 RepID=UPI003EB96F05
MVTSVAKPKTTKRRKRAPGWVPDQHGAWAMLTVPLLLGITLGGFAWVHLPLTVTWFIGYFAFFAAGLWLKSRRKAKYVAPMRAYVLAMLPTAALTIILCPHLVVWAGAFLPLMSVSLWCSHRRKDRSLLNDAVTVAAACLMLPVAYHARVLTADTLDSAPSWAAVWVLTGIVFLYFFGTVFYVKTIIRERGSRSYLIASLLYHAVATTIPLTLYYGIAQWQHATTFIGAVALTVFFALLTVRAWIVPRTSATPKQVGLGELAVSILLVTITLFVL